MTKKAIIIIAVVVILVLLAIFAAIKGWYAELPKLTTQWLATSEIKSATKIQKNKIPVKGIIVLDKKTAAEKLKLPEAIAKDDKKQIIATAEIPPYEGKTDAVAIMDKTTGEAEIIAKQQSLSLFGLENKKAVGLRYGYSSVAAGGLEVDIYGRWDFLRIGDVHAGFYGEVTSTGDRKAMLNMEYRF